jgi:hypothetical protein
MNIIEFKEWLNEEIRDADETFRDCNEVAPNSYGTGHAYGWREALYRVRLKLENKLDD